MKLFRNELEAREKIKAENNLEETPYSGSPLVRTLNKHLKKINMVKVSSCYECFFDENMNLFYIDNRKTMF